MVLMKVLDIIKAEGDELFLTMDSEKISVGIIQKIKILVVGVLGPVCTLQFRISFSD